MRSTFILIFTFLAGAAQADPGHFAEVAGHDHWVAGAALGAAIAIALWAGLRGKGKAKVKVEAEGENAAEADADSDSADAELQEA